MFILRGVCVCVCPPAWNTHTHSKRTLECKREVWFALCVCVCDQCLCVFMSGFRRVSLVICSDLSHCQKSDDPQSMSWKNRCVCVERSKENHAKLYYHPYLEWVFGECGSLHVNNWTSILNSEEESQPCLAWTFFTLPSLITLIFHSVPGVWRLWWRNRGLFATSSPSSAAPSPWELMMQMRGGR